MANYDLQYEGPAIDSILDTGKKLEDDGYIFLGLAAANTTSGTPDKRVFYFAGPGSYSGFSVTIPTGAVGIFAYNGSAWVTSVINTGSIYDVSSANSGRTYASLSTAIEDIPSTARKAGMEIKFVNTSTSKYEVWIYQGTSTSAVDFTNTANWIGVDETPLSGSNNLVSSGGIYNAIQNAFDKLDMMDSTGTSVQSIQINVTLRRNDGTEEDPDWQTVASLVLPSATTTKAGLMSADDKAKITNTDGVFDISEYTASGGTLTQYASLSAALGTNGINVPQNIRKGGMSVKFVQSSDNKYVQFRCIADEFTIDVTAWQGVDTIPTEGSKNLVESGGVKSVITNLEQHSTIIASADNSDDLSLSDEEGNEIVVFKEGHLKIKNFDSKKIIELVNHPFDSTSYSSSDDSDIEFSDENGNVILELSGGGIKTKNFDSNNIVEQNGDYLYYGEKIDMKERTFSMSSLITLTGGGQRQSIATYGKYLISSHINGVLVLYDLESKTRLLQVTVPVDSSILATIHGSNISFGTEFVSGNTDLPAIYVCETTGNRRCFVVNLQLDGTITLLQTITFTGTFGNPSGNNYRDFLVDRQNSEMWIIGYYDYHTSGNYTICKKVPLRSISDGDIAYGDNDVLQSFNISEITVIQGAFIFNNHLFIGDQRRWVVNIDIEKEKVVGYIKLNSFTSELEGIANYNNSMLVDINANVKQLKLF